MQKTLFLVSTYLLCVSLSKSQDPCLEYTELDEWRRSVANADASSPICDTFLSGWYRVTSGAGENMPTECINGGFRCGTISPIWMNGSYPSAGHTSNVTVCASSYIDDCCVDSYSIMVKNCSGYYVYNLVPPTACPQGYCFGHELPCPLGETSETGFTPGCHYDPCLEINHKEINNWERSTQNNNTDTSICDSFLEPGWYRATSYAGELMPTSCLENGFACGTVIPIWMNGSFPSSGETNNVTGCSSSYNGDCCVNSYNIQVKNCSRFLVYNLRPTIACPQAYCFGSEVPCPEGESSDNGFTPGCEFDPCHFTNYEVIKDQVKRSSNYVLMADETPIDDSNLMETFYRFDSQSGNDIVNSQQNMYQCGTKFPMYMIGSLPNAPEQTVLRKVCLSGHQGICQNETEIKVRNCGEFRVYGLKPSPLRFGGYCVGTLPVKGEPDPTVNPENKTIDDDIPWIITVVILGVLCIALASVHVYKKLYTRRKVKDGELPPPYSPKEISKVPVVSYLAPKS